MISNYYSNVCIKIILTFLLVLFHTEISQSQVFEKFLKLNDSLDKNINNLSKEWFLESGSYYIPINTKLNNDIIIVERLKSIILELNYQCSEQSLSKFFFNADVNILNRSVKNNEYKIYVIDQGLIDSQLVPIVLNNSGIFLISKNINF